MKTLTAWVRRLWAVLRGSSGDPHQRAVGPKSGPLIRSGPVEISVGLDFGTHGTKAVYFQKGVGARVYRPVIFDHGVPGWENYVLPAVGLIEDGALVWGSSAAQRLEPRPWNDGIRRLKAVLAAAGDQAFATPELASGYRRALEAGAVDAEVWRPEHVAAAALAHQIVEVQQRLAASYQGREIKAQYAIPVPIDHVTNSRVNDIYRRVANTADLLVGPDGALRYPAKELVLRAAELYDTTQATQGPDSRIDTLPEAVAQISSYLNSLATKQGVHGVIDIGAGTTDVSIFNLSKGSGGLQECVWYAAIAIPQASAHVQERVAASLDAELPPTEARLLEECSKYSPVVWNALEEIRHAANPGWTKGYNHLRSQTAWEGCPVFLTGGGAHISGARRTFGRSWMPNWKRHALNELPTPNSFHGAGLPFDRMAVAFGLAIPGPEHGDYILPPDAPDNTPPKRTKPPDDGGGDQLVPKPGWV